MSPIRHQVIDLSNVQSLLNARRRYGINSMCCLSGVNGSYRNRQRLDSTLDLPNCNPGRIRKGL